MQAAVDNRSVNSVVGSGGQSASQSLPRPPPTPPPWGGDADEGEADDTGARPAGVCGVLSSPIPPFAIIVPNGRGCERCQRRTHSRHGLRSKYTEAGSNRPDAGGGSIGGCLFARRACDCESHGVHVRGDHPTDLGMQLAEGRSSERAQFSAKPCLRSVGSSVMCICSGGGWIPQGAMAEGGPPPGKRDGRRQIGRKKSTLVGEKPP